MAALSERIDKCTTDSVRPDSRHPHPENAYELAIATVAVLIELIGPVDGLMAALSHGLPRATVGDFFMLQVVAYAAAAQWCGSHRHGFLLTLMLCAALMVLTRFGGRFV